MWLIGKDRTEDFKIIALVSDLAMANNKNNILRWWSFLSLVEQWSWKWLHGLKLTQLSTNSPENLPNAGVIGNSHKISMGKLEPKAV